MVKYDIKQILVCSTEEQNKKSRSKYQNLRKHLKCLSNVFLCKKCKAYYLALNFYIS